MYKTRLFYLVIALMMAVTTSAQTDSQKEEMLKRRAKEKVGQFCDYVSFIASKKKNEKTRFYYVDKAKNLFLNRGKALYDDDGSMVRDSVIMQVTSLKAKKPRNVYLNKYLPNLAKFWRWALHLYGLFLSVFHWQIKR